MAVPVTVVYWANLYLSRGFSFPFGPGIQPSVCTIYTIPHVDSLPNVGTLTFYTKDENGDPVDTFEFPDCLLKAPSLEIGVNGQFWTLPILDRRWKWEFGWIDGSYNIPQPNGITFTREKTPRELASLLLDAMEEVDYDVSRLPDDDNARPHVEWISAHPASELDQLCQLFDCIIVLNPLTNKVEIWPEGEGGNDPDPPLPSDKPYSGLGFAFVYPPQPKEVIQEAGSTLFESVFRTEPVGKDIDGTWKNINDLSYKPATGWGQTYPPAGFKGFVTGTYTDAGQTLEKCDLADSCVGRCFRLVHLVDGGNPPDDIRPWAPLLLTDDPDLEPQKFRDLRIFGTLAANEIAASEISEEDGALVPVPATAYTKRTPIVEDLKTNASPLDWPYGFSLESDHGIATFSQPVILQDTNYTSGIAQSADATHITLAVGASTANDTYNGSKIEIIGGTGNGQVVTITDYVGGTLTATVAGWAIQPDSTSKYQIWYSQSASTAPAIVRIRCAFYAGKDGVFHRHFVEDSTGSTVDTPSRLDKHKEIQRVITYSYNNTTDQLSGTIDDNVDDCETRLNYWLAAALAEFGQQQGGTANYEALVPLSPDGLIQQISWSAATNQGPKTVASAAQRHNRYVPSLDNQRHGVLVPQLNQKLTDIDNALRQAGDLERRTIA